MNEHVECASCGKQMPLQDFGLKSKPKYSVRFLCVPCYQAAIDDAQITFNQLFAAQCPGPPQTTD